VHEYTLLVPFGLACSGVEGVILFELIKIYEFVTQLGIIDIASLR
jgi:hypothetical protein